MSLSHEQLNIHRENSTEKVERLESEKEKVEKLADRLGKPIDEEIKEAVILFHVYGFPTTQSCEGHITENGASYPWIEITSPEPEGWKEDKDKQREWTLSNLEQRRKMLDLLSEFYQGRDVPFERQLSFRPIGMFGGFRIQTIGSETIILFPPEEQKKKREEYKKEIDEFTKFLHEKFFVE